MTNDTLFEYAARKGYCVLFFNLPSCKSLAVYDNGCYIGLDKALSLSEQKELLSHELGHCEYGGFYNRYSGHDVRGKSEYRANAWAFSNLTPPDDIESAIQNGITTVWDLAEHFDVSYFFMKKALDYYTEACGYVFDCV